MNAIMNHNYSSQYLECVNCHKSVILHWYMRHASKCIKPEQKEVFAQAAQNYHNATTLDPLQNTVSIRLVAPVAEPEEEKGDDNEIFDKMEVMKELHVSRATVDRWGLMLRNAGYTFPDRTGPGGGKGYTKQDVDAIRYFIELHKLGESFEKAAVMTVAKFQPKPAGLEDLLPQPKVEVLDLPWIEEQPKPVVPDPQPAPAVQDDVVPPNPEDAKLLDSFHKVGVVPPAPTEFNPRFKDWVDCSVERIEDFGVIVFIKDFPYIKGLIHRSNVREGKINSTDLHRFFRPGDTVNAQVVDLSKKRTNKLGLSTKHSVLPDYYDYNQEVAPGPVHKEDMPSAIAEAMLKNKDRLEQLQAKSEPKQEAPKAVEDRSLQDVMTFIQSKVGVISPAANEKIHELIHANGVFKFTLALAAVASDFQVDLGLIFASEIEKKMGDSL